MDTVVLLPGMLCDTQLWMQPAQLLRQHAEILQIALTEPSIDGMVEEVLRSTPPRFSLAGLSLGGIVAMALVRRAPERVDRLALFSTNARAPRPQQLVDWQSSLDRLAAGSGTGSEQRRLLPYLLHQQTLATRPDLVEQVLSMADRTGPEIYRNQLLAQASRIDERPMLAAIRCPVLVAAARHDALCSVGMHEEIAGLAPSTRLQVVEGAGHLSPMERPAQVADLLHDWLTDWSIK